MSKSFWTCQSFGLILKILSVLKYAAEILIFVSPHEILSVKSFGLTLFDITVKWVRSYGPDMMWTDGQTARQTDKRTGWFLYPPPPPNFVCGSIKTHQTYCPLRKINFRNDCGQTDGRTDRQMSFTVPRFRERWGKIKLFIDYAQGLVQFLLLIFTLISFLHRLSSWKRKNC